MLTNPSKPFNCKGCGWWHNCAQNYAHVNCVDAVTTWYHTASWYSFFLSIKTIVDNIEWSDCRRFDCVLCRCISNLISDCRLANKYLSFKTTVGDIKWSDSGRIDSVDCIHQNNYDIISQAGKVYLSFKTTVDDIEQSACRIWAIENTS